MKLIADENFPPTLISYLQKKKYDVIRIQRNTRGISDLSIKEKAWRENRIIVTCDKDFLKDNEITKVNIAVFDFPLMTPSEILPYMDNAVNTIIKLKRKKRSFKVIFSKERTELVA